MISTSRGRGTVFCREYPGIGEVQPLPGVHRGKAPEQDWLALKVGRQEFSYGSGFILSPNLFFSGLAFDAARFRVKPASIFTIDFLGGYYAVGFNNGLKGNMEGVYATCAPGAANAVEAYFLRDTGSRSSHPGEHRDIWGLRAAAKVGPVALEFEPVYESGKVFNPSTLQATTSARTADMQT